MAEIGCAITLRLTPQQKHSLTHVMEARAYERISDVCRRCFEIGLATYRPKAKNKPGSSRQRELEAYFSRLCRPQSDFIKGLNRESRENHAQQLEKSEVKQK